MTVRFLQVGAGAWGRAWLHTLATSPDAELAGLVDVDISQARAAAEEFGFRDVPVAAKLDELLGVHADAVLNVTVPQAHHAVITEALLAGFPVLTEKPFAPTVAECLSLVAASEFTGRLVMVSQSRRYWRALPPLRKMLSDLAPLGTLSCRFFKAPRLGGFKDTMTYPLLLEMAIHHFDLARLFTGCEPESVFCTSYNPSWSWLAGDAACVATFRFANGAIFNFDGSFVGAGRETSWNGDWRINGAGGTAFWDGDQAPYAVRADESEITAELGTEPQQLAGSLIEFVRTLREGGDPAGEAHSNVLSLAMVEAAIQSGQTGLPVRIGDVVDAAYATALRNETHEGIRAQLASWPSPSTVVRLAT